MTLKKKIAINISIAFSILFGLASSFIYFNFATFRKEEFKNRLQEKALTTAKLLIEVKKIDNEIMMLIDKNRIDKLLNEKTLVFDGNYKLIYSSLDDTKIKWTKNDLVQLKVEKTSYKIDGDKEILGIYLPLHQGNYYVLISAEDTYGNSKLQHLLNLLLLTYCVGVLLVWIFTYFFIKKQLKPLDLFQEKITTISANELNIHLEENQTDDEINLLTKAFNQMLTRLESSFNSQKEFTSSASHELYTPLTRVSLKLENLIHDESHSEKTKTYLKTINDDIHQIADLIDSLLLLAKVNKTERDKKFKLERIDEIIFDAVEQVKKSNSNFQLEFILNIEEHLEKPMEFYGIKSLLIIAFYNLLKNAYSYSNNKKVVVNIVQEDNKTLEVRISNSGATLNDLEVKKIFEPFMRGSNSSNKVGSGLGLPIVKRIFDYHGIAINYNIPSLNTNEFIVNFPI